jgi:hypothetical protein
MLHELTLQGPTPLLLAKIFRSLLKTHAKLTVSKQTGYIKVMDSASEDRLVKLLIRETLRYPQRTHLPSTEYLDQRIGTSST